MSSIHQLNSQLQQLKSLLLNFEKTLRYDPTISPTLNQVQTIHYIKQSLSNLEVKLNKTHAQIKPKPLEIMICNHCTAYWNPRVEGFPNTCPNCSYEDFFLDPNPDNDIAYFLHTNSLVICQQCNRDLNLGLQDTRTNLNQNLQCNNCQKQIKKYWNNT